VTTSALALAVLPVDELPVEELPVEELPVSLNKYLEAGSKVPAGMTFARGHKTFIPRNKLVRFSSKFFSAITPTQLHFKASRLF
jgi:hypothetical protein